MSDTTEPYAVVVPTVGRPELRRVIEALDRQRGPRPQETVAVDDRAEPRPPLDLPATAMGRPLRALASGGRGPAAARNTGWRAVSAPWVVFLDDDVVPAPDWAEGLAADLSDAAGDVGGSQARIEVPIPRGRRPRDGERGTLALAHARWITADMAYRRSALAAVGGFDERFTRAYREDTDLALRVMDTGRRLVAGRRRTVHPLRATSPWRSVGAQRGNADDVLMRRRHGPRWRDRVGERRGRLRLHAVTTAALGAACGLGAWSLRRPGPRPPAAAAAAVWAVLTAEFAARRIAAGPRGTEALAMAATSAAIPPAACLYRLVGEVRHRRATRAPRALPAAILFDRDGTLVHDVPYNGDPDRVRPVDGAARVLERLRGLGIPVGVVSNQSGVARGLITPGQLRRVNARVAELLGPFSVWRVCPHAEEAGCSCRKPAPGLVRGAAAALGVSPRDCVVIGDTGGDVEAARAAGARPILVPNGRTRAQECREAPEVADTIEEAVAMALRGRER